MSPAAAGGPQGRAVALNQIEPSSPEGVSPPEHERAFRRLREMILHGELAPGQPVTIQGLVELLGQGTTPVREAIRRLTSLGALVFHGNRRVSVPELSAAQFGELAFARLAIEPELARRATPRLTDADIDALEALDHGVDEAIERGDVRAYLAQNHLFHQGLYDKSGAEVLLALNETLWLRSGPSLRVVLGRQGTANLPDMHQEALGAMRARDPEGVAAAIEGDIRQGIAQVEQSLGQA